MQQVNSHVETRWNSQWAAVNDYASACCDLDLSPFDPKSNQHIYESNYISDQNWVKFPALVFEIRCSQGFWVTAHCDLDLLTPKSDQHIYEPEYTCEQNWVKFPSLVLRYGVHKIFGIHRLTYRLADGQTSNN